MTFLKLNSLISFFLLAGAMTLGALSPAVFSQTQDDLITHQNTPARCQFLDQQLQEMTQHRLELQALQSRLNRMDSLIYSAASQQRIDKGQKQKERLHLESLTQQLQRELLMTDERLQSMNHNMLSAGCPRPFF